MLKKTTHFFVEVFVSLILVLFCFTGSVMAQEQVDISSNFAISYNVDTQNVASVELLVVFENLGEDVAVLSSYDLKIGAIRPDNISVESGGASLPFSIIENSGLSVRVNLGETRLSAGESYSFAVKGSINDFLNLSGGCYEKMISTLVMAPDLPFDYIKISYPLSFGDLNVFTVEPEIREENGFAELTYSDLSDTELIFFSIGDHKNFSFNVERELANPTETYVSYQLVLPPDTEQQSLIVSSITPYPDSAVLTDEGNYQLSYQVPPESDIWVRIGGFIQIDSDVDSVSPLSQSQNTVLLDTSSEFIEITNADLMADILELDFEASTDSKVDGIYSYLKETLYLSENFRSLHEFEYRKGANTALTTYKNASSEDFADSFVAIARLLQIPSRVVYGYVFPYSSSGGELGMFHVWPQYWDSSTGWISVDPAYEEYSGYNHRRGFGFNHVILGVDSDLLDQSNWAETSGEILITQQEFEVNTELKLSVNIDSDIESGKFYNGSLILENRGDTVISDISISNQSPEFQFNIDDRTLKSLILPGESISVAFDMKFDKWYETGNKSLILSVNAESPKGSVNVYENVKINLSTVWWGEPLTWFLTILLFLISATMLYFLGRLFVGIFRRISKKGYERKQGVEDK